MADELSFMQTDVFGFNPCNQLTSWKSSQHRAGDGRAFAKSSRDPLYPSKMSRELQQLYPSFFPVWETIKGIQECCVGQYVVMNRALVQGTTGPENRQCCHHADKAVKLELYALTLIAHGPPKRRISYHVDL
jgi:hypothetical protein